MTIDSDDEKIKQQRGGKYKKEEEYRIDPDFRFDVSEDPYVELLQSNQSEDVVKKIGKPVSTLFLSFGSNLS